MRPADASSDDQLVDLLDEALTSLRQCQSLDPGFWERWPDHATEGPVLLSTLNDLAAVVERWSSPGAGAPSSEPTGLYQPERPPDDSDLPQSLGRYHILGRLGSGGMGEVFLAHDPQLGRQVALKMPRLDRHNATAACLAQRFAREARAAAAVRHPHVCPVYDVGEQDSTPFVVMAYVEGESLADRLRRTGRFEDIRGAVSLVSQVADALAAVHAHGIVHRDLKPANILLDAGGNPLLTDFGLALWAQEEGPRSQVDGATGSEQRLTHAGMVLGTLAYMSPEQARGDSDIGQASDLYSLGVVLYEMLTGRIPFEGPGPVLLHQILHDTPPPPTTYRPELDEELSAILQRALATAPADRFPDAPSFAAALRDWLDRRVPIPLHRRYRWWWWVGGSLTAVAALVALWVAGQMAWVGSPPASDQQTRQAAAVPLEGQLTVTISSDKDLGPVTKTLVSVDEEAALPVREGELARVEVRLNRPAYTYLLWVDSQGNIQPIYPWDVAGSTLGWQAPWVSTGHLPQKTVQIPATLGSGISIEGPAGLETVVLLGRTDPLPANVNLVDLVGKLPQSPYHDPGEVAWLRLDPSQKQIHEIRSRHRGIKAGKTRPVDKPLFNLLEDRLRPHFQLIQAVRFAHAEP